MHVTQPISKEPVWVSPANPAAGAEWTTNIPTTYRPEFIFIHFAFTTDANVATRSPNIKWSAGGVDYYWTPAGTAAAGEAWYYIFAKGVYSVKNSTGLIIQTALPESLVWGNGGTLSSSTTNIQVGDQYANIDIAIIPHFNA